MELTELLAELRESRLDDAGWPPLWSDEELVGFLNDAVRQVCIRQRCLLEAINPAVCRIPFVAGQRLLKLHPTILAVRWAGIEGYSHPLEGITAQRMRRYQHDWDVNPECHDIRYWVPDYHRDHIALSAVPETAGVLLLNAWRTPLAAEMLDPADPTSEPVVPTNWHSDLLDWGEYRAFSKKDSEMRDEQRAARAYEVFERKIGRLPSATEITLWGIKRGSGSRAEFI